MPNHVISNEGMAALCGMPIDHTAAMPAWEEFVGSVVRALGFVFDGAVGVVVHNLADTEEWVRTVNGQAILNLDACLNLDTHIGVSRCFAEGGVRLEGLIPRPGTQTLREQLAGLDRSITYTLVDDVIFTGGTVAGILEMLEHEGVRVSHVLTGIQIGQPKRVAVPVDGRIRYEMNDVTDVNDARDFIVGGYSGGLVVRYADGLIGRVPYLDPFVSTEARCSIPAGRGREFSLRVWEANVRFWERFPAATVSQLSREHKRHLMESGFSPDSRIVNVCNTILQGL